LGLSGPEAARSAASSTRPDSAGFYADTWSYNERNGYNGALIAAWVRDVVETEGTNTTLALEAGEQTPQVVRGSELVVLAQAGHFSALERPAEVADIILAQRPCDEWSRSGGAVHLVMQIVASSSRRATIPERLLAERTLAFHDNLIRGAGSAP
jgi:hypothetical protein